MTERQAAMVNSRWSRYSAAGVSLVPIRRQPASVSAGSQDICGGHSRKDDLSPASPAVVALSWLVLVPVNDSSCVLYRTPGNSQPWHMNNSWL
jgi:hypothetical protein